MEKREIFILSIFMLSLICLGTSLSFLSLNLTGNAIGNFERPTSNLVGIIFGVLGIFFGYATGKSHFDILNYEKVCIKWGIPFDFYKRDSNKAREEIENKYFSKTKSLKPGKVSGDIKRLAEFNDEKKTLLSKLKKV